MNERHVTAGMRCGYLDEKGREHLVEIVTGDIVDECVSVSSSARIGPKRKPHCLVKFVDSQRTEMVPLRRLSHKESGRS